MLDSFFIQGAVPLNAEAGTYDLELVLASFLVAVFGSYAGLTLTSQLQNHLGAKKIFIQWLGAMALGSGIWSMHFIGMIAYKMRMPVHYDIGITLISMLIAAVVAYFVIDIARKAQRLSNWSIAGCAVLLGLGICAMHYVGMQAMQMEASLHYKPWLFLSSFGIAVTTSALALWLLYILGSGSKGWREVVWRFLAAAVMGIGICAMHYTGMAASVFLPFANCRFDLVQDISGLALTVLIVTGALLLILTFAISSRLFLTVALCTIFVMPLVVIIYQATTSLNRSVALSENKQHGIYYHNKLLDLLERLQELRGVIYLDRKGGHQYAGMILSKQETVRRINDDIDTFDVIYGASLRAHEGWVTQKKLIADILTIHESVSPDEEYRKYSDVIVSLKNFMDDVVDNSQLSTNTDLDSNYLAEGVIHTIPNIMQTIGKIRGLATGLLANGKAPKQWGRADKERASNLYGRLLYENEDIVLHLQRAQRANQDAGKFIKFHEQKIAPLVGKLYFHISHMVENGENVLSTDEFFKLGAETIAAFDALYDLTSDAFLDILRRRQEADAFKRNLVLCSSTLALLGFFALFVFLYRTLAKTEFAEKAAEAANRAKSDFLANTSHELRTPLNSILGMTKMLLEGNLGSEQDELAKNIYTSSTNLLEIVNDILDLSKIEAGEIKLERIGFDPRYVLQSVVNTLDPIAKSKDLPIIRRYEDSFPYLLGDPTRLNGVLMNLIGNAVKYTDKGCIEVTASFEKVAATHVELRCEVSDTGIGVPRDKQSNIFEKFVQADTSTTRKYGGTGLGLAITRQLVELMGGKIGMKSREGSGSVFWFTIPYEITDQLHVEDYKRSKKKRSGTILPENAHILVAEDHPMNQIFIRKLLEKFRIKFFQVVDNGAAAVTAYETGNWDIVLMDCHMPEKNGYDATIEIRSLEKTTGRHTPIVAMTANAMIGDREKCLRCGMDDYVSKPIKAEILQEILGQWIDFRQAPTIAAIGPAESADAAPVDLAVLSAIVEGDLELERILVGTFIKQSDKNIESLKVHLTADGVCTPWREAAHMLKGGAGSVGAEQLRQFAHEAQQFRGGADQRAALFEKIAAEYLMVKAYLEGHGLTDGGTSNGETLK